jgi:hypothetical protein
MSTTKKITAEKTNLGIQVQAGTIRAGWARKTKSYDTTVAASAIVTPEGEVHSVSLHKTIEAAQNRRPRKGQTGSVIWTEVADAR